MIAKDGMYLNEEIVRLVCIICGKKLDWDFSLEGCGYASCCGRRYDSYVTNVVSSSNEDNV